MKIESLLLSYVSLCTIFKPMRTSAIRKRSVLRYPCLVSVKVPSVRLYPAARNYEARVSELEKLQ